ncbi:uncharacterized protein LOC106474456 [Limulus polyphemus]|uniref:Uncharacterized protein LOC106474456 n=1 Tax=Limulus polyphemus TaxID=6850 RepID=A0ABM1TRG2_LIMPO|nr:uncharacterized protein LOC106474456 [Limulus polyphemus]XP_022258468.1 uncharacterized protein LOC106474456 [Limulus polyphemus]XP_022258469.1 uncharacterized protein LOC106474456 [Limulus polyphemus]XP_022258470.1 uncharacterized protein LOC106474456 [Limulus polyphemus]XP_022258471.1 uncharacterized protein LOC106474456 [Limulus polyphemus]XP_022258472.1 uncharacterized protein LOC106474456 [Limulus polyphemus]XP_022258473.1 uncharacterized protein LOC106474456 [Limulus polyphemus]XP_0
MSVVNQNKVEDYNPEYSSSASIQSETTESQYSTERNGSQQTQDLNSLNGECNTLSSFSNQSDLVIDTSSEDGSRKRLKVSHDKVISDEDVQWEDMDDSIFAKCLLMCKKVESFYLRGEYVIHSGGARGSDQCWEVTAKKYGIKTIAYSFRGHASSNPNRCVLSQQELSNAEPHLLKANKTLKRKYPTGKTFIDNLLRRNWFQVQNSDAIFAIGKISKNQETVEGGTGWAVQMGIDNHKQTYVFDCIRNNESDLSEGSCRWYSFCEKRKKFVLFNGTPLLTKRFAGIGSRRLSSKGQVAIEDVFRNTFKFNT